MPRRAAALVLAALVAGPAAADSLTYRNDRFGTTVAFPAEIFRTAMEPPENGDGMTFLADDGASIAVYGFNNALMVSPDGLADQAGDPQGRPRFTVTYRRVGKDWAVVSGLDGGDVFYQRFEFGAGDVIHAMLMRYPASAKSAYDPLVGPIAASLSGP